MRLVSIAWRWPGTAETPAMHWWRCITRTGDPTAECSVHRTATTTAGLLAVALRKVVGGLLNAVQASSTQTRTAFGWSTAMRSRTCKPVVCWSNSTSKPIRLTTTDQSSRIENITDTEAAVCAHYVTVTTVFHTFCTFSCRPTCVFLKTHIRAHKWLIIICCRRLLLSTMTLCCTSNRRSSTHKHRRSFGLCRCELFQSIHSVWNLLKPLLFQSYGARTCAVHFSKTAIKQFSSMAVVRTPAVLHDFCARL